MNGKVISNSCIRRLPRYYRFLGELKAKGVLRISSGEFAKKTGLTASQIRQDLNCFGDFGQQGYGYNIELLHGEIGKILGLNMPKKAILIGVGNLGKAVAQHINFESMGYQLVGIFDKKEALAGQIIRGLPVRNISGLDEFCRETNPSVAILCIPKDAAAVTVNQLTDLSVKAFWNFSHYDIKVNNPDVIVENMHFGDSLMTLSYRLNNQN